MSKFHLASDYKPTGDQPTAIEQLVSGIRSGEREQTLLGVTGSGKSVTGDTSVYIRRGESIEYTAIESVIERLFTAYPEAVNVSGESEFIDMVDIPFEEGFSTISFSPSTGAVSWSPVYQVSRHVAEYTIRATTTCGRAVRTTADHNFYVARDGELALIEASDLRASDVLPVPRTLEAGPGIATLCLAEELRDYADRFYVGGLQGRADVLAALRGSGISKQKIWRIEHEGERVRLDVLLRCKIDDWTGLRIGSYRQAHDLPVQLPLSEGLLRLIGYYIAEGCYTAKYVIISNGDKEVADALEVAAAELGARVFRRADTYDYQLSSVIVATLLLKWAGRYSKSKHMPGWWPGLSRRQLGLLLGAYFDGDGSIEKESITATTVSSRLSADIQSALAFLGIPARVRMRTVQYSGMRRDARVISISGDDNRRTFRELVPLLVRHKRMALKHLRMRTVNTNVDTIPIRGRVFRQFRTDMAMTQRELARYAGVSRTAISLIESGLRYPSYAMMSRLHESLSYSESPETAGGWLDQIAILLGLRWARVGTVERLSGDVMVYDFAVESDETFLAGDGGIFVHNTFTMANIVQQINVPTLVLAHNKTLAAQLYSEFKAFFPDNEVHYFVSYFDYYQPEAYIASSDTYIEKDSKINEEIDRLRHAATTALLTRRDTLIVASVSCIYGIGSPDSYAEMSITVKKGERRQQDKFIRLLTDIQYQRNDMDFARGTFRVKGDVVDVFPAGSNIGYRIEFFGDDVDRITAIDPLTGEILNEPNEIHIFPSSHYVTPKDKLAHAIEGIKSEFEDRLAWFEKHDKHLEAQRLAQRTRYDIEMLEETGFVKGIENYSRYLTNREPGEQPATLIDYFPDDWLLLVDESHVSLPQVRGMYNGDRARKEILVEHGFRLPSAMDNRPLRFDEFDRHINKAIYVSATPGDYELEHSPAPAQQVIRPTGLLDPEIEVRPSEHQVDDVVAEIRDRVTKGQRVLITTLTKRMAEDLSTYLQEIGVKTAYIHSEVDTLERGDILKDLRMGVYDVLVGINLLREGLDLPEVSLVAIIDADKEGFLRSESSLIQTIGRAARHVEGKVILYGDKVTRSMQAAIDETNRRRGIQQAYNEAHGITPRGIDKKIDEGLRAIIPQKDDKPKLDLKKIPKDEYGSLIKDLEAQMDLASANLEFEKAAELRDTIAELRAKL